MRIILVHNYYGSKAPSGENYVMEAEQALLEQHGHTVVAFTRHSDEIRRQGLRGVLRGAASVPWNPFAASALRKQVEFFKPDVVHAHNTFPLISPSIFHAIGNQAASVLTLHNYRLLCAAGIPMRGGQVCTQCIDQHSVLPALHYGCYRNSRIATLPLAANVALHRRVGTWQHEVDAFVALSAFQKQRMTEGGLPGEKVHVKPNFYAGNPEVVLFKERVNHIVFVGRLGEEKGVRTLIEAWQRWGKTAPELRMIGDGPLGKTLRKQAEGLPITFLGQLSSKEAQAEIANARLLVLPSECFEGFPMVVREAFAFGTPVAVSDLGPLPSIVKYGTNGVLFEPANSASLFKEVEALWNNSLMLNQLSDGARSSFDTLYNEDANYKILTSIYQKAIERNEMKK